MSKQKKPPVAPTSPMTERAKKASRRKLAGSITPSDPEAEALAALDAQIEHAMNDDPATDSEIVDDAPMMQTHSPDSVEHVDADGVVTERPLIDGGSPYVEDNGQIAMLPNDDEADDASEMLMRFSSADEVMSTAQALAARAADLRALAKKAREIGRQREAVSIEREAAHIGEFLLPQVQTQIAIAFNDLESLLDALVRSVGRTVRNAAVGAIGVQLVPIEGESHDDTNARRKELLDIFETVVGGIAEHAAAAVLPFIEETAERAYEAGLEARNTTPNALAVRAVQSAAEKQD